MRDKGASHKRRENQEGQSQVERDKRDSHKRRVTRRTVKKG